MKKYDVVVIGAGPAGALAAYHAARQGLAVLLLDRARFPRAKVCGCCLNARAVQVLRQAGCGELLRRLRAVPLNAVHVHVPGRYGSFALRGSLALSRENLDAALVRHAESAGASFMDTTTGTLGALESTSRVVELGDSSGVSSKEVRAGLVLIADGLAGTALRRCPETDGQVADSSYIGAGVIVDCSATDWNRDGVTLACGDGGYVGIVRVEDGRMDVAAALDRDAIRTTGGVAALAARLISETGLPPVPELEDADWKGTPALTRRRPTVAGERFFVLGDAAGYVEPFTGEGMAWALESAQALATRLPGVSREWNPRHATDWTRRHRSVIRRRQWACRALTGTLRRPWLIRNALGVFARFPRLASPLVHRLTQPGAHPEAAR